MILNNCYLPHLNYVGDSIVGNKVNLGAGVILANFKAGSKNEFVDVELDGKRVSSGLKKLGAFLADGVKVGSNCVTAPGTIIGKNTSIYPLCLIRGTIEANKVVKNKPHLEITDLK